MPAFRRIDTREEHGVTLVRLLDRKVIDASAIQELGEELFALVERCSTPLVLDFSAVEFLSSAANNKLIILDNRMKARGRVVRLCCMRPEIYEVFLIQRLQNVLCIRPTLEEALAGLRLPDPV